MSARRIEGQPPDVRKTARQAHDGGRRSIQPAVGTRLDADDARRSCIEDVDRSGRRIDGDPWRIGELEAQGITADERLGIELSAGVGFHFEQPVHVVEQEQSAAARIEGDVHRILDRSGDPGRAGPVRNRREVERLERDHFRLSGRPPAREPTT